MSDVKRPGVLIVGGGVAGLAAGHMLARRGCAVKVFEAEDRVGGRARVIRRPDAPGDVIDGGTQYVHSNYRRGKRLLREVGLGKDLRRVGGKTRFFDDRVAAGMFDVGHRLPMIRAGSVWQNVALVLRGAARIFGNPIDPYAVLEKSRIDGMALSSSITDPFEYEFTARTLVAAGALVEPGWDRREVSYLQMVRLMWIVLMTEYYTLDGGIESFHRGLARDLDVALETPVARLLVEDGRTVGVVTADGAEHRADHVILAAPAHAAGPMLPEDWTAERAYYDRIEHPAFVLVTLFLDGPLVPGVWSYILRPDPDRLTSFCVDAAEKNPRMTPSRKAALQSWIVAPNADRAMEMSDAELVAQVTEEMSPIADDLAARTVGFDVQRYAHSVPQFPPGRNAEARDFLAAIDARPGLEVCGDHLSGGYMESALWSAERAADRIAPTR